MKTLGVYLAELLEDYGVDTIFGIPGVHTVELYRGLPNTRIRHVTPRHEQGAGFMADGYARATGKPGVCLVITGPGMTNILTAMAQAYADSIPMLVISAVNGLGKMGSGNGHLHELKDQRRLAEGAAAFSHTVFTPADLDQAVARAFALFSGARPRPVHIEIPTDIITMDCSAHRGPGAATLPLRGAPRHEPLGEAAALLASARAPLLLVGGGAVDASAEIRELAERLDAPVIMTVNGRGILPPGHPLSVSANASLPAPRALMAEADVILAIGTEIGPTDYDWNEEGPATLNGSLIRVDIDPEQAMRGHRAACIIIADAAETARELLSLVPSKGSRDGAARSRRARAAIARDGLNLTYRASLAMLETVRQTLPDAVIVGDSAQPVYAASVAYEAERPRAFFCSATGFGTLGYALPAAIGAKIGQPDRPVICLIGDGGLQFSVGELASAVEAKTPIIILLWNNFGYGEIKSFMVSRQIQPIGVDIGTPNFVLLAKAFGAASERLEAPDDLARLLSEAASRNVPTLIEINEASYVEAKG